MTPLLDIPPLDFHHPDASQRPTHLAQSSLIVLLQLTSQPLSLTGYHTVLISLAGARFGLPTKESLPTKQMKTWKF